MLINIDIDPESGLLLLYGVCVYSDGSNITHNSYTQTIKINRQNSLFICIDNVGDTLVIRVAFSTWSD